MCGLHCVYVYVKTLLQEGSNMMSFANKQHFNRQHIIENIFSFHMNISKTNFTEIVHT